MASELVIYAQKKIKILVKEPLMRVSYNKHNKPLL